jgi:hypothetical protein
MAINLRYDLRIRFDQTLVDRLEAAWRLIDRFSEVAVWWDAFHANRIRRSYIRHRSMYRIKAKLHVVLLHTMAVLEGSQGHPVGLCFFCHSMCWVG